MAKTVQLDLVGREVDCYCMTCSTVVSTKVFEVRERETQALVQQFGGEAFMCKECQKK